MPRVALPSPRLASQATTAGGSEVEIVCTFSASGLRGRPRPGLVGVVTVVAP